MRTKPPAWLDVKCSSANSDCCHLICFLVLLGSPRPAVPYPVYVQRPTSTTFADGGDVLRSFMFTTELHVARIPRRATNLSDLLPLLLYEICFPRSRSHFICILYITGTRLFFANLLVISTILHENWFVTPLLLWRQRTSPRRPV